MPAWDCVCERCGHEWRDWFAEAEEGVACPVCDAEDFDATRVNDDNEGVR